MPTTTRRDLPYPRGAGTTPPTAPPDPVNVPGDLQRLAEALDNVAFDLSGLAIDRPAAALVADGTYWYSTDTGELDRSDGANWAVVGTPWAVLPSPFASVYGAANGFQSVPSGVLTVVGFNAEEADNGAHHDNATNNSRLVCHVPGIYAITGSLVFPSAAGGNYRQLTLRKTTTAAVTTVYADPLLRPLGASDQVRVDVDALIELAAGDYVELLAFQDSGGPLGLKGGSVGSSYLRMVKVGIPNVDPVPMADPPTAHGARAWAGAQSIPNGSFTAIAFGASEEWNTDGIHSLAVNNTRMTIPAGMGGRWLFHAHVEWNQGVGGERLVCFRLNDAGSYRSADQRSVSAAPQSGINAGQTISDEFVLAPGQFVEVIALVNTTGGSAPLNVTDLGGCQFTATYLGA